MKKIALVLFITLIISLLPTNVFAVDYVEKYTRFLAETELYDENNQNPLWDAFTMDLTNDGTPELIVVFGNSTMCSWEVYAYAVGQIVKLPSFFTGSNSTMNGSNMSIVRDHNGKNFIVVSKWSRELDEKTSVKQEHLFSSMDLYEITSDAELISVKSQIIRYTNIQNDGAWTNKETSILINTDPEKMISEAEGQQAERDFDSGMTQMVSADWFVYYKHQRVKGADMTRFENTPQHISVVVNNKSINFDQEPVIENERTLVPMRAIFEALNATVLWDEETTTITAQRNDITIKVQIGNSIIIKGNEEITLDVPPKIMGDRTLVPIRAVSECLGTTVAWHEATKTVIING